jgi:hypothetical protein
MNECSCCPATENLRRFGDELYCEDCIGDGIRICAYCGASGEDEVGTLAGVDFCYSCRGVESLEYYEWDDGVAANAAED